MLCIHTYSQCNHFWISGLNAHGSFLFWAVDLISLLLTSLASKTSVLVPINTCIPTNMQMFIWYLKVHELCGGFIFLWDVRFRSRSQKWFFVKPGDAFGKLFEIKQRDGTSHFDIYCIAFTPMIISKSQDGASSFFLHSNVSFSSPSSIMCVSLSKEIWQGPCKEKEIKPREIANILILLS